MKQRLVESNARRVRRIDSGEIGRRSARAPRSELGDSASMRDLFPSELTPEGEQFIIPGAEKKQTAPAKPGDDMMKTDKPQAASPGPLFGDIQTDLIEHIRLKRADEVVEKAEAMDASVMQAARCMSIKGLL